MRRFAPVLVLLGACGSEGYFALPYPNLNGVEGPGLELLAIRSGQQPEAQYFYVWHEAEFDEVDFPESLEIPKSGVTDFEMWFYPTTGPARLIEQLAEDQSPGVVRALEIDRDPPDALTLEAPEFQPSPVMAHMRVEDGRAGEWIVGPPPEKLLGPLPLQRPESDPCPTLSDEARLDTRGPSPSDGPVNRSFEWARVSDRVLLVMNDHLESDGAGGFIRHAAIASVEGPDGRPLLREHVLLRMELEPTQTELDCLSTGDYLSCWGEIEMRHVDVNDVLAMHHEPRSDWVYMGARDGSIHRVRGADLAEDSLVVEALPGRAAHQVAAIVGLPFDRVLTLSPKEVRLDDDGEFAPTDAVLELWSATGSMALDRAEIEFEQFEGVPSRFHMKALGDEGDEVIVTRAHRFTRVRIVESGFVLDDDAFLLSEGEDEVKDMTWVPVRAGAPVGGLVVSTNGSDQLFNLESGAFVSLDDSIDPLAVGRVVGTPDVLGAVRVGERWSFIASYGELDQFVPYLNDPRLDAGDPGQLCVTTDQFENREILRSDIDVTGIAQLGPEWIYFVGSDETQVFRRERPELE